MAKFKSLAELRARKQLLIAKCETDREALAGQAAQLRRQLDWVPAIAEGFKAAPPWLMTAAPVLGLVLGRKQAAPRSLGARILLGWKLYRSLSRVLDAIRGR